MQRMNFGRNVPIDSKTRYSPKSENEVLEILDKHRGESIRCIGRLHSWSQILRSPDVLLDMRHFNGVTINRDDETMSADVGAGCQIKHLLQDLEDKAKWTLPSVGFITEQTIAGAISTGTHGSGRNSLSHYVLAMRVARYDKETGKAIVTEIKDGDELLAARCSLGCLGVILSVTMQCRDMYRVEEHFQKHKSLSSVLAAETSYPLQQFYLIPWQWTWIGQHRCEQTAASSRLLPLFYWYRFIVFDVCMHLLILACVRVLRFKSAARGLFRWILPNFVIRNWRVTGPSTSQLVMEHEMFHHIELELFVERPQLAESCRFIQSALVAVGTAAELDSTFQSQVRKAGCKSLLENVRNKYAHHYPICIRRILPDDTLISMASSCGSADDDGVNDNDWFSITLTNYHRGDSRRPFLDLAEFLTVSMSQLFEARPHWGKLCSLPTDELTKLYPGFNRFLAVCDAMDPEHRFCNPWTRNLLRPGRDT